MTRTQNTPGYNRRIAIFFATSSNGKRVAYRWSPLQFRSFRIPLADAETMQATETADVLPGHPMKR